LTNDAWDTIKRKKEEETKNLIEFFINIFFEIEDLLISKLSNKEWVELNITYFLNLSKVSCP
jgi:hypothetical protein